MGVITNIAASSLIGSLILGRQFPEYALSRLTVVNCSVLFLVQFLAFAVWKVILYPNYFSPLRHLPEPKVGVLSNVKL
jgi:hypothetical protein